MKELEADVAGIVKELESKEKRQDELLVLTRSLVRSCSLCIKMIHGEKFGEAGKEAKKADSLIARIRKADAGFRNVVMQSYQEYAEMRILLGLIDDGKIPRYAKLGVPYEAYLNGLCDCAGELRREMLEELRRGKKKKAEGHFTRMKEIYNALLAIRFSNSLLPGFRRKQDVARIQLEQARSEILRR
ncbi:MAG: hypothetical protein NT157_00060 [Candidatus Micrarchaeota archaeon]|nr:hypothetical protein [Candidatus Micrarchaeota archaeon]